MLGRFFVYLDIFNQPNESGERIEVMQPERSQHKDLSVLELL